MPVTLHEKKKTTNTNDFSIAIKYIEMLLSARRFYFSFLKLSDSNTTNFYIFHVSFLEQNDEAREERKTVTCIFQSNLIQLLKLIFSSSSKSSFTRTLGFMALFFFLSDYFFYLRQASCRSTLFSIMLVIDQLLLFG
jgi:hypothetical protein